MGSACILEKLHFQPNNQRQKIIDQQTCQMAGFGQMQTKTNLYIYLLFNEVCNDLASLTISPEPAEIARFYVLWTEVPEDYNPVLEPQQVPTMKREGFTVLEWGGIEVEAERILNEEL